ncbi:MAG: hypothetical protein P4L92_09755 [Rudaea sp.]|nr:hypothetical protein [Rudaea sp.]
MKALCKTFVLLLASAVLASCGGGGSGSHSAFTPPGNDTSLQLVSSTLTLPASPFTVGQEQTDPFPGNYLGSPYIAEVTVTWRHNDGSFVSGTSPVNVSVAPTTILTFSTLDSTTTTSGGTDQFHTLLGSGPVNVTAGVGTIYVHAGQVPGVGVLTVTATDPVSNQTISAQVSITVAGASTGLPSSITASASSGVYISGSGGPQSTVVTATVTDGSGALVQAPSGVDNVQFQILGPAGNDATLASTDAAGNSRSGTTVVAATHNGIAAVTFQAGTQQGPVQVQAVADRGDNNVDNGIQNPVSATTTVVVSDGKLDSLTLSFNGSLAPSILINRVSTQATLTSQSGSTLTIPPDPDATYSFTVTALGVDRQGNPVLPGTQIKFGSIDSPVDTNGNYLISGTHGDPQEGGTGFTATDGHFRTAGGGSGPGDSLLVFGKLVQGNTDLESAAKVVSVLSDQSLTVSTPFNLNDTTGATVNYGPVLPYIIGRAQIGNVTSPAVTNSIGRATTTLNYPASELGHVTALWAQGNSTDNVTNGSKLVTDIALIAFPGLAPATIVISPNPIPGNLTTNVIACIDDALGSPIQGVSFQFSFDNLGVGSGTLDGISGSGTVPDLTDTSGCVSTVVKTTGIATTGATGSSSPQLTFSAGTATNSAPITAGGNLILLAIPSALGGNGGTVTLSLLSSNGTPVPGVQLTGTCTGATVGIASGPGVTNSQGQTTAVITANLNIPNAPGTGSCTFTTSTGSPTVIVNLQGTDPCLAAGASPGNPACTSTTATPSTVALSVVSGANTASFTSNPAGASCSGVVGTTQSCSATLNGGTYTLTAVPSGGTATAVTWSGSCTPSGTNKATLIVPTTAATGLTCTATEP